jgi:hypothetical protein
VVQLSGGPWSNDVIAMLLMVVMAAGEPATNELDRAMAVLQSADESRVAVDLREETLAHALMEIASQLPVPFRADWKALERLGVREDTTVTLRLNGVAGLAALASLALGLGDEFERPVCETDGTGLVLTSINGAATMRVTGVYDIRDLLANELLVGHLRETAPMMHDTTPDREADRESPGEATSQPVRLTPGEQLVLLITDHVDPDAWINFGGNRGRITERNGLILLTAPPMVHRRFRDALSRLRAADPRSLAIEAVIVELPRTAFDKICRLHGTGSAGLAAAVRADAAASVLWRSGDPIMLDNQLIADSVTGDIKVRVAVEPVFDRESGTVNLTVDAAVDSPGDQRSVKTTIAITSDAIAVPIELPASGSAPDIRTLIITLRRR